MLALGAALLTATSVRLCHDDDGDGGGGGFSIGCGGGDGGSGGDNGSFPEFCSFCLVLKTSTYMLWKKVVLIVMVVVEMFVMIK